MASMPRPPPVTLTITCGARRTTVARCAAAGPGRAADGGIAELGVRARRHAVRRVEQPVAPLDEHAVDGAGHGSSPLQAVDQRRGPIEVAANLGVGRFEAIPVGPGLLHLHLAQQGDERHEIGR